MAGVKGRSGGARQGAGRKQKPPATESLPEPPAQADGRALPRDPKEFLERVMLGQVVPSVPQLEAAKLLVRIQAAPAGGKKQKLAEDAEKVAGKFGARPAPLKLVNGK